MKKKKPICITQLPNMKFLSFHKDLNKKAEECVQGDIVQAFEPYRLATEKYDKFLHNYDAILYQGVHTGSGKDRDQDFIEFRKYVKACAACPDSSQHALCCELWKHLKNFTKIAHAHKADITAKTEEILTLVKELTAREPYSIGFMNSKLDELFTRLDVSEESYLKISNDYNEILSRREQENNSKLRADCMTHLENFEKAVDVSAIFRKDPPSIGLRQYIKDLKRQYGEAA